MRRVSKRAKNKSKTWRGFKELIGTRYRDYLEHSIKANYKRPKGRL